MVAVADLDRSIAEHLRTMRRKSELPPLAKQPRVRGKKPHDPKFDVRDALYLSTGVDLTAIEGIDAIHALTLVSELGTDFSKWPTVKYFTSWLGLCPNLKKTGGKVQSSRTRLGKNRAAGAVQLRSWRRGPMRSMSYLGAYLRRQRSRLGSPKAVIGDGPLVAAGESMGVDEKSHACGSRWLQPAERAGMRKADASEAGEAVPSSREGAGVRSEENRPDHADSDLRRGDAQTDRARRRR